MTQHSPRICIDPPNIAVGPKIDANALRDVAYIMLPGQHDATEQHCILLHITWHVLDQSRSRNSDRDITIQHSIIPFRSVLLQTPVVWGSRSTLIGCRRWRHGIPVTWRRQSPPPYCCDWTPVCPLYYTARCLFFPCDCLFSVEMSRVSVCVLCSRN